MTISKYTEEDKAPYIWARDMCNKRIVKYIAKSELNALPTEEQCVSILRQHISYTRELRNLGAALIWDLFMPDLMTTIREQLGRRRQIEREWQLNTSIAEGCISEAFSDSGISICVIGQRYRVKVMAKLWEGKVATMRFKHADIAPRMPLESIIEELIQIRELYRVLGKTMLLKNKGWRMDKESYDAYDQFAVSITQTQEYKRAESILRENLSSWNFDLQLKYKALIFIVFVRFGNGSVLKFRVHYKRIFDPVWAESVNEAIALVKSFTELPCSPVDIENTRGGIVFQDTLP